MVFKNIIITDVTLRFEQSNYTVNENDSSAEICMQLNDTGGLLSFSIVIAYVTKEITAGKRLLEKFLSPGSERVL